MFLVMLRVLFCYKQHTHFVQGIIKTKYQRQQELQQHGINRNKIPPTTITPTIWDKSKQNTTNDMGLIETKHHQQHGIKA